MITKNNNYLIEFTCFDRDEKILSAGKMRVKNKESDIAAKVGLERYLQKQHKGFGRLVVKSCQAEHPLASIFGNIPGMEWKG